MGECFDMSSFGKWEGWQKSWFQLKKVERKLWFIYLQINPSLITDAIIISWYWNNTSMVRSLIIGFFYLINVIIVSEIKYLINCIHAFENAIEVFWVHFMRESWNIWWIWFCFANESNVQRFARLIRSTRFSRTWRSGTANLMNIRIPFWLEWLGN